MQNTDGISRRVSSLRYFLSTIVAAGVALFLLGGMSAQSKDKEHARPFRFTGLEVGGEDNGMYGTWVHVGNATHMGMVTGEGAWEITGEDNGVYFFHVWGTYTAANGDSITIESTDYSIDWNLEPAVGVGTVQVLGGTGRFADASGSWNSYVLYSETREVLAEGTICY